MRARAGIEQIEHVDPGLRGFDIVQIEGVTDAESHRRRAHLLAVVATVEAVAEHLPVLDREAAGLLHQPRQAAVGIDDARFDDGTRGAAVEATPSVEDVLALAGSPSNPFFEGSG